MEPDRFTAIAPDEQRAVIAINEEYLRLQGHVPAVVGGDERHPGRVVAVVLGTVLVVLLALAWWFLR